MKSDHELWYVPRAEILKPGSDMLAPVSSRRAGTWRSWLRRTREGRYDSAEDGSGTTRRPKPLRKKY